MRPVRVEPTSVECVVTVLPARAWALSAALLALLALLAALLLQKQSPWIDPARLAPIGDYAIDSMDSTVFALEKARSPARDRAALLVLGSSATREALLDEAALNAGYPGGIVKITSSAQNPTESLFLLRQRPLRAGQVVVLFVGVTQLSGSVGAERLESGLFLQNPYDASTGPDSAQRKLQEMRGARKLLVRYLHYALPHQVNRILYGVPPVQALDFYHDAKPPRAPQLVAEGRKALQRLMQDKAAANMPAFRASLDAIAAHCAQAGATLVLAENPHHGRDIDTLFAPWWDIYRAQVEALAQRHGVRYINFNDTLPLPASAFTDVTHTNAAGRAIWSGRFLDEAVRWRQEGH